MPDNVGFFVTPPLEAGGTSKSTGSFGYSWHISANSDKVAASAAFLDWMSNENAAREFFDAGDIAPLAVDNPELKPGELYQEIYDAWTSTLDNNALMPYLEFATPTAPEVQYPTDAAGPGREDVGRRRPQGDRGRPSGLRRAERRWVSSS